MNSQNRPTCDHDMHISSTPCKENQICEPQHHQVTTSIVTRNCETPSKNSQSPSSKTFFGLDSLELRRRNSLPIHSKVSIQYRAPTRTRSLRVHESRPTSWNPSTAGSSSDVDTRVSLKNTKRSPSCDRYFNEDDFSQINAESMRMRPPRPPSASSTGELNTGRVSDMVKRVELNLKVPISDGFEGYASADRQKQHTFYRAHTIDAPNAFIYSTSINQMECDKENSKIKPVFCQLNRTTVDASSFEPNEYRAQFQRSRTLPLSSPFTYSNQPELQKPFDEEIAHLKSVSTMDAEVIEGHDSENIHKGYMFSNIAPESPRITRTRLPNNRKSRDLKTYSKCINSASSEITAKTDNLEMEESARDIQELATTLNKTKAFSKSPVIGKYAGNIELTNKKYNIDKSGKNAAVSSSNRSIFNYTSRLKCSGHENEPYFNHSPLGARNTSQDIFQLIETEPQVSFSRTKYLPSCSPSSRTPSPMSIDREPINNLEFRTFQRSTVIHPSVSLYEICQFCDIATVFVSNALINLSRRPSWWKDDPVSSLGLRTRIARVCTEGEKKYEKFQLLNDTRARDIAESRGAFKIVTPKSCSNQPVVLMIDEIIAGSPMADVPGIEKGQILVELNGINLLSTGNSNKSVVLHLLVYSAIRGMDAGEEFGIRLTVASPNRAVARFENGCIYFTNCVNSGHVQQGIRHDYTTDDSCIPENRTSEVSTCRHQNPGWLSSEFTPTPASSCSPSDERIVFVNNFQQ